MKTHTARFFEQARKHVPNGTNYALSKATGVSASDLPDVLSGEKMIGNAAAYKLAALLGIDPALMIARIEEDRAMLKRDDEKRNFWQAQARRIIAAMRGAAVVLLALGTGLFGVSNDVRAQVIDTSTVYYG